MSFLKVFIISAIALGLTSLVVLKVEDANYPVTPNSSNITVRFQSQLPSIVGMTGMTLCASINISVKAESINPYLSLSAKEFWRHEFEHLAESHDMGCLHYLWAYHGISVVSFLKHWDFQKSYVNNSMEIRAVQNARSPYKIWMLEVLKTIYGPAPVGF